MDSIRQNKISRLIQKELGDLFLKEMKVYSLGSFVTITMVRVSPDLSIAKIYLSVFAAKDKKEVMENLSKNSKDIRFELGKRVRHQLRIVPELVFYLDDSLDYAEKIDQLLK